MAELTDSEIRGVAEILAKANEPSIFTCFGLFGNKNSGEILRNKATVSIISSSEQIENLHIRYIGCMISISRDPEGGFLRVVFPEKKGTWLQGFLNPRTIIVLDHNEASVDSFSLKFSGSVVDGPTPIYTDLLIIVKMEKSKIALWVSLIKFYKFYEVIPGKIAMDEVDKDVDGKPILYAKVDGKREICQVEINYVEHVSKGSVAKGNFCICHGELAPVLTPPVNGNKSSTQAVIE